MITNLTSIQDDWNIDADGFPQSDVAITFISGPHYLVDELGNFLSDLVPNYLIAYEELTGVYPIELSSIQDDNGLDS